MKIIFVVHLTKMTSYAVIIAAILLPLTTADELCDMPPGAALYSKASDCLTADNILEEFSDLFTITYWDKLCRQTYNLNECIQTKLEACGEDFVEKAILVGMSAMHEQVGMWLPSTDSLIHMMAEGCQGEQIRESISDFYSRTDNLNCMNKHVRDDVTECVATWLDEMKDIRSSGNTSLTVSTERRNSLIRFGRSSFQCARNLVKTNCSHFAQDLMLYAINQTFPDDLRPSFTKAQVDIPLNQTYIMSTERSTVGIYSNSHLLVFNVSTPITCSTQGPVIYLSNQLFSVTGRNRLITNNGITVLSELSIEFYRTGGGVTGKYVATSNRLEDSFEYGDIELSPYHNPVQIMSVTKGVKVQINSTSRAYIMLIQRHEDRLMLTVRISQGVLRTSSGVLISGCSYRSRQVVHVAPVTEVEDCADQCRDERMVLDEVIVDLADTCAYDCSKAKVFGATTEFLKDLKESRDYDYGLSLVGPSPTPVHQTSDARSRDQISYPALFYAMVIYHLIFR